MYLLLFFDYGSDSGSGVIVVFVEWIKLKKVSYVFIIIIKKMFKLFSFNIFKVLDMMILDLLCVWDFVLLMKIWI